MVICGPYGGMVKCRMVKCQYGNMWPIGYDDVMGWRDGKTSNGKMSVW